MKRLKRALKLVGLMAVVALLSAVVFVTIQCSRFDASMARVYDVPSPPVTRSTEPAVVARGKHLVESIGACASRNCHGADLGGGEPLVMGPVATLSGPNITPGHVATAYSDGELARLLRQGIRKDGTSVRFMPAQDFGWLPDSDLAAIVSYVRTVPVVDRPSGATVLGILGKVLDRQEKLILDVARHVDHAPQPPPPAPGPTAEYGRRLALLCEGCHGEHLQGGPLPGAPSSFAVPLNLTPDATGLAGWTFADFENVMRRGQRKNGKALDALMPTESWNNLDDVEMHALWAYLQTLPPGPFGAR